MLNCFLARNRFSAVLISCFHETARLLDWLTAIETGREINGEAY